jgi:hypothetical protein
MGIDDRNSRSTLQFCCCRVSLKKIGEGEMAHLIIILLLFSFFSYEDILQDFYDLVYQPNGEPYPPNAKDHITKDNGLVWLLLQLFCKLNQMI